MSDFMDFVIPARRTPPTNPLNDRFPRLLPNSRPLPVRLFPRWPRNNTDTSLDRRRLLLMNYFVRTIVRSSEPERFPVAGLVPGCSQREFSGRCFVNLLVPEHFEV